MLINADCSEYLKTLEENSIDSLVTDPPAGISFMGKEWDKGDNFVESMTEIYKECLRVLKPGAHGLVWAIPRTSHWTATALEQAGFEIRDVVTHIFGTGFPKSLDVSKAIDKMMGAEREASPASPEAKRWSGFGTALKPASEHWILVRKRLSESTVAKNVLKHGTGALNIDASRISVSENDPNHRSIENKTILGTTFGSKDIIKSVSTGKSQLGTQGRFPANLVLSHNEDCDEQCTEFCPVKMLDEQSGVSKSVGGTGKATLNYKLSQNKTGQRYFNFGDIGGASRFFYCAKASKRDRNEGLDGMPSYRSQSDFRKDGFGGNRSDPDNYTFTKNIHPTVKNTKLMEYLIRLITPPSGVVLDPFMGSGSTGVAAKRLGFGFVGIEKDPEYFEIAKVRINGKILRTL